MMGVRGGTHIRRRQLLPRGAGLTTPRPWDFLASKRKLWYNVAIHGHEARKPQRVRLPSCPLESVEN